MRDSKGRFTGIMREDITGQKFNELTALSYSHKNKNRKTYWNFLCSCGQIKVLRTDGVKSGHIKSCGCIKEKQNDKNLHPPIISEVGNIKSNSIVKSLYRRWYMMKDRCYNPENRYYKHYGGRGITVCDEWLYSFRNYYYWSMNNGFKIELEIDRRDNDGNYCPENCRFVTRKVNVNNRRCSKKQANTEITKGTKEPLAL